MEKIGWQNSDLREAIKTHLPDWIETIDRYNPPGPDRVTYLSDISCPKCGKLSIFCIRNDFGHVDNEIKCAHVCVTSGCKYFIKDEIDEVSFPDIETSKYYCSICGNKKE